jgi:phosphonate transport system substrate-binding protein
MQLKSALLLFVVFCILVIHSFCGSRPRPRLVLATYAYSTNNRVANLQPLAQYLQHETGFEVEAVSYPNVQALIAAIQQGKVHLAMINTLGYLSFQRKHPGIATPLVSLDAGDAAATNYGGCVLARAETGIATIEDALKDDTIYRFALVASASTSGNLVPRLLLNSKGINDADKQFLVYYAGTHKQVIDDLLAAKAALGGCGCHEYEKNVQADKAFAEKLVKIAEFKNIPLGPIVYHNTMPRRQVEKIEAALLKTHERDLKAFQTFRAGWTEFLEARKFKPVKDADYNGFRNLFGDNELLWNLLD